MEYLHIITLGLFGNTADNFLVYHLIILTMVLLAVFLLKAHGKWNSWLSMQYLTYAIVIVTTISAIQFISGMSTV